MLQVPKRSIFWASPGKPSTYSFLFASAASLQGVLGREFPEASKATWGPGGPRLGLTVRVFAFSPRCVAGASQNGRSASASRPTSSRGGPRSLRTSWRSVTAGGERGAGQPGPRALLLKAEVLPASPPIGWWRHRTAFASTSPEHLVLRAYEEQSQETALCRSPGSLGFSPVESLRWSHTQRNQTCHSI